MELKRKKYKFIEVWEDKSLPGVFCGRYSPNLFVDLEIAKELVSNRQDFAEGKPSYYLIDLANIKGVSKEAREYMSHPNGGLKGVLGGAFISDKILTTTIINLFLKINKPHVPTRFFTQRDEGVKWLREIMRKIEK